MVHKENHTAVIYSQTLLCITLALKIFPLLLARWQARKTRYIYHQSADSVGLWFPGHSIDIYADHNRQSDMMSCSALE